MKPIECITDWDELVRALADARAGRDALLVVAGGVEQWRAARELTDLPLLRLREVFIRVRDQAHPLIVIPP